MGDLAARLPAREVPSMPTRDRWLGAGRALAGEIWGANYAGTIPSYGLPVVSPSEGFAESVSPWVSTSFALVIGPSTPVVWSTDIEDLYWQEFRPPTPEFGVTVWESECLVSIPAWTTPLASDHLFWTSEGFGESSILVPAEAKLSPTDPADSAHAPAWRRSVEARSTVERPRAEREPAVGRDVHSELRLLIERTRLSVERLGELVGASRRTIYNWLAGRPIREEAQSRILRLHDGIAAIANSRDPVLVRDWLLRGDPSPATLAAGERWDEFEARVRQEMAPLRPIEQIPEEQDRKPRAESSEVLRAALVAFSTASDRAAARRPDWMPREITGIAREDEEDAE